MWLFNASAILRAGGRPRRIVPGGGDSLVGLDGLVIGGGDDIAPTLYGDEIDPAIRLDPERDALELHALDFAMASGWPVLGTCRGAQILNVARGGNLHREVHEVFAEAQRLRTPLPLKTVHISMGSRLHEILGRHSTRVNALHHQAICRLGEGLEIVARDEDGIVQAIEGPRDGFMIGVQWHPEFLAHDRGQMRLYAELVRAC
jgi:putative glutamine amidotransferase